VTASDRNAWLVAAGTRSEAKCRKAPAPNTTHQRSDGNPSPWIVANGTWVLGVGLNPNHTPSSSRANPATLVRQSVLKSLFFGRTGAAVLGEQAPGIDLFASLQRVDRQTSHRAGTENPV
jgi:hypothetical protein